MDTMIEGQQKQVGQQEERDINNQHNAEWAMTGITNTVSSFLHVNNENRLFVCAVQVHDTYIQLLSWTVWINGKPSDWDRIQTTAVSQ